MPASIPATPNREAVIRRYAAGERDFRFWDLHDVDLSELTLDGADFSGCNLKRTNFTSSGLAAAAFRDADMQETMLNGATAPDADFSGASMHLIRMREIDAPRARLVGSMILNPAVDELDRCLGVV